MTGLSDSTNLEQITCTYTDCFIWQHQLGANNVHIHRLVYLTAPTLWGNSVHVHCICLTAPRLWEKRANNVHTQIQLPLTAQSLRQNRADNVQVQWLHLCDCTNVVRKLQITRTSRDRQCCQKTIEPFNIVYVNRLLVSLTTPTFIHKGQQLKPPRDDASQNIHNLARALGHRDWCITVIG